MVKLDWLVAGMPMSTGGPVANHSALAPIKGPCGRSFPSLRQFLPPPQGKPPSYSPSASCHFTMPFCDSFYMNTPCAVILPSPLHHTPVTRRPMLSSFLSPSRCQQGVESDAERLPLASVAEGPTSDPISGRTLFSFLFAIEFPPP
jgi:hypothetical protein